MVDLGQIEVVCIIVLIRLAWQHTTFSGHHTVIGVVKTNLCSQSLETCAVNTRQSKRACTAKCSRHIGSSYLLQFVEAWVFWPQCVVALEYTARAFRVTIMQLPCQKPQRLAECFIQAKVVQPRCRLAAQPWRLNRNPLRRSRVERA